MHVSSGLSFTKISCESKNRLKLSQCELEVKCLCSPNIKTQFKKCRVHIHYISYCVHHYSNFYNHFEYNIEKSKKIVKWSDHFKLIILYFFYININIYEYSCYLECIN